MRYWRVVLALPLFWSVPGVNAQPSTTVLNPTVKEIVNAVSEERIGASMKKLEGFGTRYILSEQDSSTHGIGAAQQWIFNEFQSYSPRLQVSLDKFTAKKGPRVAHDVDLANVLAVLPGTLEPERFVIISAHYDSISSRRGAGTQRTDEEGPRTPQEVEPVAPGVADDASGVAAVMELARVMSQYKFDKSIIFVTFAAEEVGLMGSAAYAAKARQQKMEIEAVLNNDIIGSETAGNGRSANGRLRVFSEGPEDSTSRSLARYTKEIAERYNPSMSVDLVFRRDRFGRGGDHTSFNKEGFTAVRLTTASENYANQHTVSDTFANASVPYTTRVAKMNAAVLATLALAPRPPVVTRPRAPGTASPASAVASGTPRPAGPGLTRGKSGYDAALRWEMPKAEPDLAGYAVVLRSTTSPLWEREIYVGNVTEFTIPDVSIDDVVIGVKAIDKDGNSSLVSAYDIPALRFDQSGGTNPAVAPPQPAAADKP